MPTYVYKAMTKNGQIVKNRITEANKVSCAQRLKRNELIPITITQTIRTTERNRKKPMNFNRRNTNKELKRIGTQRVREKSNSFINRFRANIERKNNYKNC